MGIVAQDLDQLSAETEHQHRSELRVSGAAQDQFVSGLADHRLHGYALEAAISRKRFLNRDKSSPNLARVFEVQKNASAVRLMRDRLRMQLHDNREAGFFCRR